jgi:hypothetical protein
MCGGTGQIPIQFQQVEGVEDGLAEPTATMELVKCRDPIGSADHRLAIKGEGLCAELRRGRRDRRKPFGPIIAPAREKAHALAVAADDQPITIVLDFMCPQRAGRRLVGENRDARLNEAGGKHATFLHRP